MPLEYRDHKAEVIRWVDGDTVFLKVDLDFRIEGELEFRLLGIDTPEKGKPGYKEAIAFVNEKAPVGGANPLIVRSYKDPDKYGRWLGEIFHEGISNPSLNQLLVDNKLAVTYFGGKKSA